MAPEDPLFWLVVALVALVVVLRGPRKAAGVAGAVAKMSEGRLGSGRRGGTAAPSKAAEGALR